LGVRKCGLLGCDSVSLGECCPTFRKNEYLVHALSHTQTASQQTGAVIVTVGNVWMNGVLYRDWACSTGETWSNVCGRMMWLAMNCGCSRAEERRMSHTGFRNEMAERSLQMCLVTYKGLNI
jgi:hypothetical protein